MVTRRRGFILGFGMMALSMFFVTLALEVLLRISGLQGDFFFQLDPEIGAIHIPGKQGWAASALGRQYIEINSHGYRGHEWTRERPPGTYRIAVLGDSFVEAFHVPLERTFAGRLQEALDRECGDARRFEVLNFGVSGFGTAQELETLRLRALHFQPDVVLLYFYGSNDLYDNSSELDAEPNRLHFTLGEDGRLVPLPFEVRDNQLKQWLRQHSRLYLFVRHRVMELEALDRAMKALRLMQKQADPRARARRTALRVLQDNRYQVPPSPALERAWRLTEALLSEARRLSEEASARFGLVVIPNKEEILDDGPRPAELAASWDFQQSLRRIERICKDQDIACLQLVGPIRASGLPIEALYIPNDGHWTDRGHALVAAETLPFVRRWACGTDDPLGAPGARVRLDAFSSRKRRMNG